MHIYVYEVYVSESSFHMNLNSQGISYITQRIFNLVVFHLQLLQFIPLTGLFTEQESP